MSNKETCQVIEGVRGAAKLCRYNRIGEKLGAAGYHYEGRGKQRYISWLTNRVGRRCDETRFATIGFANLLF